MEAKPMRSVVGVYADDADAAKAYHAVSAAHLGAVRLFGAEETGGELPKGIAHIAGKQTPIGPGSCFHLPPEEVHCIENTGPAVMRIMGVFHPSGSPASRARAS